MASAKSLSSTWSYSTARRKRGISQSENGQDEQDLKGKDALSKTRGRRGGAGRQAWDWFRCRGESPCCNESPPVQRRLFLRRSVPGWTIWDCHLGASATQGFSRS